MTSLAVVGIFAATGNASVARLVDLNLEPAFTIEHAGVAATSEFVSVYTSGPVDPGIEWNELVVTPRFHSNLDGEALVEVRTVDPSGPSRYYRLGSWRWDRQKALHSSLDDPKVDTDVLALDTKSRLCEVRVATRSSSFDFEFHGIALSFRDSRVQPNERPANRGSWGRFLEPPRLCQMRYPGGSVLCSPTSLSMVLQYWRERRLFYRSTATSVLKVAAEVYDPKYRGHGNWSFNCSYAASYRELWAAAVRMGDLRDLEDLIEARIPVVCSVSYELLQGRPARAPDDGHLVVLCGFTQNGDPVFNDPGRSSVRQTYRRADFLAAWSASGRTSYLIYPKAYRRPRLSVDGR